MEKRVFSRTEYKSKGVLKAENQNTPVEIRDISLKGAMLCLPPHITVEKDGTYELVISLENSDVQIQTNATITHISNDDTCGIRFNEIDIESLTHLRRIMEVNTGKTERIRAELGHLVKDD